MDARSKRREATRRQLEQQLKERQAREARRKRTTLIASVVGTVVVIALVVVLVVVLAGGNDKKAQAGSSDAVSPTAPASSSAPPLAAPAACTAPAGKATAAFKGVTVANAINLAKDPKVTSTSTATPDALACDDLVVGKGAAAAASSTVSVQYSGVLYSNGKQFDSSWARNMAASFSLNQVVKGFAQGIGGTGKVTPMRIGGRRIIVLPAQLAYGASSPSASIPANAPLVFVVDLLKVS